MNKPDTFLLKSIKYFSARSDNELKSILFAPENAIESYAPKEIIFHEGDIGDHLYIMLNGLSEVYVKGEHDFREISIATLKPGDYFGEISATSTDKTRRTATIKTILPTTVYKIHKKYVLDTTQEAKHVKDSSHADPLCKTVKKIPIFYGLTDNELDDLKKWATIINYNNGDCVYGANQIADGLYLVLSGEIQNYVINTNGEKHVISRYKAGQYFGEYELLPGENDKRHQFTSAVTESCLLKINKRIFDTMLERNSKLVGYIKQMNQLKKMAITYTENN